MRFRAPFWGPRADCRRGATAGTLGTGERGCRREGEKPAGSSSNGRKDERGEKWKRRTSKSIVDAERHRRTPKILARKSKAGESEKLAKIGNISAESVGKTCQKHETRIRGHRRPPGNRFSCFWYGFSCWPTPLFMFFCFKTNDFSRFSCFSFFFYIRGGGRRSRPTQLSDG